MTTFSINESVRIVVDDRTWDSRSLAADGTEATVIGGLDYHAAHNDGIDVGLIWGYVVLSKFGDKLVCEPHELRKKHPPASTDEAARLAMLDCIERAKRGQEIEA